MNGWILFVVLIVIVLVMIICLKNLGNSGESKRYPPNNRSTIRKKLPRQISNTGISKSGLLMTKTPGNRWSKEDSRELTMATMPDHVKSFFHLLLDVFRGHNLYMGVKNYGTRQNEIQWEIYILPELGKTQINPYSWYQKYRNIFVDNFEIGLASVHHEPEIPASKIIKDEYIISISIDIDERTPTSRKPNKLNIYKCQTLDIPSYYMIEYTFYSNDHDTLPSQIIERGRSFLTISRDIKFVEMFDYCSRLGMEEPDITNLFKYLQSITYKKMLYSFTDKPGEYGLYILGIDYDTFLRFLYEFHYPEETITYVKINRNKIEGSFLLEFGMYFKKGDSSMTPTRSAFYMTINQ